MVAAPTTRPPASTTVRSSSRPARERTVTRGRYPTARGPRRGSAAPPQRPASGLDHQRNDHRSPPVALVHPPAHDPADHLLQLVDVADAARGGLGEGVDDARL